MSEHQHYAFRAVDRRLSPDQQAQVRTFSSRTTITATGREGSRRVAPS